MNYVAPAILRSRGYEAWKRKQISSRVLHRLIAGVLFFSFFVVTRETGWLLLSRIGKAKVKLMEATFLCWNVVGYSEHWMIAMSPFPAYPYYVPFNKPARRSAEFELCNTIPLLLNSTISTSFFETRSRFLYPKLQSLVTQVIMSISIIFSIILIRETEGNMTVKVSFELMVGCLSRAVNIAKHFDSQSFFYLHSRCPFPCQPY